MAAIYLLFLVPALLAAREGWGRFGRGKRLQFGTPELMVMPLACTPTMLGLLYAQNLPVMAMVAFYHVSFAFYFWTGQEPGTWSAAQAVLMAVLASSLIMCFWGLFLFALVLTCVR